MNKNDNMIQSTNRQLPVTHKCFNMQCSLRNC